MPTKTTNYGLTKPAQEEFYNVDDFNGNTDIIDAELKKNANNLTQIQQEVTTHLDESNLNAHKAKNIVVEDTENLLDATNVEAALAEISRRLQHYKEYASGKDANGFFTTVEYKRTNNTLYMRSTLSNPNAEGYYLTDTWTIYALNGTSLIKTIKWTLTYDNDGAVTSKVPA